MDLFAEVMSISAYFTETHGERLAAEAGIDADALVVDLDSIKESLGLREDSLSYAELMERRQLIRSRVRGEGRRSRRAS
jgi:hypothetical protein